MAIVGIDASNLLTGGGPTHLIELLAAARPQVSGIDKVIVWGPRDLLERLPSRVWLELRPLSIPVRSRVRRFLWQRLELERALGDAGCEVLFVPGGLYVGRFQPFVTMSRNLLPFDQVEIGRYEGSSRRLRLELLRRGLISTMRRAAGVIFLTETARTVVLRYAGSLDGSVRIIPHGVSKRFFLPAVSPVHPVGEAGSSRFRWLYVSTINWYKNQDKVVEAAARLRAEGHDIELTLVGSAYAPALARLRQVMALADPDASFIRYVGEVAYDDLPCYYANCDAAVFASSVENLPNTLIEKMAAGLPIACSDRGVMPEVLAGAGLLFDPSDAASILESMRRITIDPALRRNLAARARARAAMFSWEECARHTFEFLAEVVPDPTTGAPK